MLALRLPNASRPLTALEDSYKLNRFLLGDFAAMPKADVLRRHHLAAYSYSVMLEEDPRRAELRNDYMYSNVRLSRQKTALQPLLKQVLHSNINFILLNDLFLAEFVFNVPCERHIESIDLLLKPEDIAAFSELALRSGWQVNEQLTASAAVLSFRHQQRLLTVNVFTQVLETGNQSTPTNLTKAVWKRAKTQNWGTMKVLTPSLTDAFLVGIVLKRCWEQNWALQVQDYLDLEQLMNKGVRLESLEQRAKELGCSKTLALFLMRCNPFQTSLNLDNPALMQQLKEKTSAWFERVNA